MSDFVWPWLKRRPGRPKLYWEIALVRLPLGSLQRIDRALKSGEIQSEFLREAIEKALETRERP